MNNQQLLRKLSREPTSPFNEVVEVVDGHRSGFNSTSNTVPVLRRSGISRAQPGDVATAPIRLARSCPMSSSTMSIAV